MPYAGYAELLDLLKPIHALLEMVKFEAPVLLSTSAEESSLQDIISEMIDHELSSTEAESASLVKLSLLPAQKRLFYYLRQ